MRVEPLFSADEISRRVATLGREIRAAAGNQEVFLLGILNGAALFLGDLLRAVDGDVSYGFIDVVRDVADASTASAIHIDFLSYTNIKGRNVFVVKDVVSTGVIETYLLSQFRIHGPQSVRLVALLDRPEARTVDLQVDFAAFEVTGGSFAGYGLEHEKRFGNLPHIGRVTET